MRLEDLLQKEPTENNLSNARSQEQEDEYYYQMLLKEANEQVYNITVKGWVADPSRANLMRLYNVYDIDTAKYLNANPVELCLKMVDEILEDKRKQRELIIQLYDAETKYPLKPEDCYLPSYKQVDLRASMQSWANNLVGNKKDNENGR